VTPGQLVNAVSIALDIPRETVFQHDRNLVVAGLRTFGGRGRNAPTVTPLDAACLVTAILGSVRVLDSVNTVLAFERTQHVSPEEFLREMLAKIRTRTTLGKTPDEPKYSPRPIFEAVTSHLPRNHNFIEALAALIENASSPLQAERPDFMKLFYEMEISCEVPRAHAYIGPMGFGARYGQIPIPKTKATVSKYEQANDDRHKRYSALFGVSQTRSTPGTAIMLLGRAFFENGLPPKTTQEEVADWVKAVSAFPKGRHQKKAEGKE
jgi:hypothetical protein